MAFSYKLEQPDGTPADPPTLRSAVSSWHAGDSIRLAGVVRCACSTCGSATSRATIRCWSWSLANCVTVR
jgi:hypothetical protein